MICQLCASGKEGKERTLTHFWTLERLDSAVTNSAATKRLNATLKRKAMFADTSKASLSKDATVVEWVRVTFDVVGQE